MSNMQKGPIYRKRKHEKRYTLDPEGKTRTDCPFCNLDLNSRQVFSETNHFWRVENIFGYDMWDGHHVEQHQMLVPKRHITGMHSFTKEEDDEFLACIKQAEKEGFSVFTRHDGSSAKTVPHQHTHLIKTVGPPLSHLVYLRRPHVLLLSRRRA